MIPIIILAIESPEDRAYMTALYLEHHRLMYWVIHKYVHEQWDAEDILQTALVKLIDKLETIKEKETRQRTGYILATCRNCSINFLKRRNRITLFEYQEFDGVEDYSNPPAEALLHSEEHSQLLEVWNTLDWKTAYLLEAKYVLEKSNEEIAADIDISPNSVRTYVKRARDKLKTKMKRMHPEYFEKR